QRGAGRTLGRNGASAASTITIERMVQDGVELTELLSKRLQKDKIALVGHSWGSILGVLMAKARPELFYAFVGAGQVADPTRNYVVAYAALVERASREGNSRALRELNEVGSPPYKETERASRSNANGRICLKERTYFLHPPWGSRQLRLGTRWPTSTTGLKDRTSAPSTSSLRPPCSTQSFSEVNSPCPCSSSRAPRISAHRRVWPKPT